MKFPKLTIVVPVYNAKHQLERFFRSLENQTLFGEKIEMLVMDGGSTDGSIEAAKEHHARVIHNPEKLAEPGVALGIRHAKAGLVMVLAADNIFEDAHALEKIISVFDNPKIAAAFPKHETGVNDSVYSRYFNTFTDPYTHFIYGKASNARTFRELYRTVRHTLLYDVYDYDSNRCFPLIALAQGFTVRRKFLENRQESYDDVLVVYDLIRKKKDIAYVHGVPLYHYTADDIGQFVKKQRRAVENALLRGNSGISLRGRYLTFLQRMKKYVFFPYSLSIIFPVVAGTVRWIRTGERMWLVHPFMVFISAVVIISETCRIKLKRFFSIKEPEEST